MSSPTTSRNPSTGPANAAMLEKLLEQFGFQDEEDFVASVETHTEDTIRAQEAARNRTEDPLKTWIRPHKGDCPICLLPLPISEKETSFRSCCQTRVCKGCIGDHLAALISDGLEKKKVVKAVGRCPLCRSDPPRVKDLFELKMRLAKAGRHEAMFELGMMHTLGENGLKVNWDEGLKWMQRAAGEGYAKASHYLGECYRYGDGVDMDIDQAIKHLKAGGEGGSVIAFAALVEVLFRRGDIEDAMLNCRKAVVCGVSDEDLFNELRDGFREGYITKEEYAYTLREHQKVSNEMKSESRTRALRMKM